MIFQVWTKHGGQPAYRGEAKLHLPGKTAEEIEKHEKWHQELVRLQDRKREVDNRDQVKTITTSCHPPVVPMMALLF